MTYEVWRVQFRKDCENEGKLLAFNALGEFTLKLLWESGLAPTVRAIVGSIGGQPEPTILEHQDNDTAKLIDLPSPPTWKLKV